MKTTILTTTLLAIVTGLLTGCGAGYSFIDNRYENKTLVENTTLKQALQKVKYMELDSKAIFNNNKEEVYNVLKNDMVKTCSSIFNEIGFYEFQQKELKNRRLEPLKENSYDYNVLFGQYARSKFCSNQRETEREKTGILDDKVATKIFEDCEMQYEKQREEDVFTARDRGEFMELGYINCNNNTYVPNIKPLDPEKFYTYKVFEDNLTGTLIVELDYKDYKNRTIRNTLYEELSTCEFATRSKKEVIEENERKIAIRKENLRKTGRAY